MFGHDSKPSRVYAFKACVDAADLDAAMDQIRKAHRYRNTLIETELRRRSRVDDVLRLHAPAVADLTARLAAADAGLETALADVRRTSQRERRRIGATPEQRTALAGLRRTRSDLRAALKDARAVAFADGGLRSDLDAIDADAAAEQRAARAGSGCYWGNYLFIEQSRRDDRKGAPPRFRRWDGEGALAVQLQGGLPWSDALLGGDTRLRVCVRLPGPAADLRSHRARDKCRADVWFRVGSAGRAPLWCRAVIHLHRRPPGDAAVKWAYLHRRRVGPRVLWELQVVLARDFWDRPDAAQSGSVGVDVNWRVIPEGLRVATAAGSDGVVRHLVLPRAWLSAWRQVESLRSIRDRNLDAARDHLAAWLAEDGRAVPDWLRERSGHLPRWRSTDRLAALIWHWKDARFDGDADIYMELEAWRKQNKHLHIWEASLHRKVVRRRDDLYRKFAAGLAREYREVRLEDTDWKKLRTVPPPDVEDDPVPRLYARIAAPGRLSQFLRQASAAAVAVKVPAAYTTLRCSACAREGWETLWECDTARHLAHTCPVCGYTLDQDVNAATNLLNADPGAVPAGVAHED